MLKEIIFTLLVASCVVAFPQVPSTFLDLLENPLGPSERDRRIVGGRDATIEEFPYMALMLWQGQQNCGGSILNVNTILSAAHCTFGYPTAQFTVRVGSNRITTGGQVITLARIINHESYNPRTFANDINILKLSRNLVFSASIRAILLPAQGMAIPHGSMATVSGWGAVNTAGNRSPTLLQTLQTPVIGNSQCAAINGSPIRANEMCAGAVIGRDACFGDSGGPLVFQARAVGIVSWGYGDGCAIGWPNVYVRVSEQLPFITRNLNRVPADFQIRAGSNRVGTGGQLVPVTRIIVHESYRNEQPTHDIVILKLSRNLVISAIVRAAQLPVQGFAVPAGSTALLSGWGGINTAGNQSPTVLQALNTTIMGNAACQTRIQFPVRADQLCAGGVVGRDACYGDSGGPLTFQGRFVGIVSFGPGRDCAVGWPIVYTRVSEFLPFIVRNM